MDDISLIRNSELFNSLLDDDLSYLLTRTENKTFARDTYVFRNGDTADTFYIIKSGEVVISQVTEDGKKHDLACYIAGDSFGEFDFVTSSPRDAEALVSRDCELLVFPGSGHKIDDLALEKPGTISRLYLQFLIMLSRRLRSIHSLISENSVWVKQLQEGVYIDQHTGLYTRSFLESEIPRILNPPAVIIMIKPDRFKEINDTYGHRAGDVVLQRIAAALLKIVEQRQESWAVRIRSNEIALVLQQVDLAAADKICISIAGAVACIGPGRVAAGGEKSGPEQDFEEFRLTVSMAMGLFENSRQDWVEVFDTTYDLMKKAWSDGGNRLISVKLNAV